MSFHKRYINDEQVINIYRSQGCQAVIDWYTKGADVLILSGKLAERVDGMLPLLSSLNNSAKWNQISEMISDASIEKGFNEKKH
jgi:hypothetical protein